MFQDGEIDRKVRHLEDQIRAAKSNNTEWEKKFQ